MTEINGTLPNYRTGAQPSRFLILAAVTFVLGATGGLIYGRHTAGGLVQNNSGQPVNEIIVSDSQGLVFKSENGTPLLKMGKDSYGTHFRLLGSNGKALVELNNVLGTGGIVVGSNDGGFAYMQAHEESATITLIGKYGKEAVAITSTTSDGSGSVSVNEGKQGYRAVEITAEPNRLKSNGTVKIPSNNGAPWQAP